MKHIVSVALMFGLSSILTAQPEYPGSPMYPQEGPGGPSLPQEGPGGQAAPMPAYTLHQFKLSTCDSIPEFDPAKDVIEHSAINSYSIDVGYKEITKYLVVVVDQQGGKVFTQPIEKEAQRNARFGAYWSTNVSKLAKGTDPGALIAERQRVARGEAIQSYQEWRDYRRHFTCSKSAHEETPVPPPEK